MRAKPWPILAVAFIFIAAPLFNILWSANLNHTTVYDYLEYIYFSHSLLDKVVWIFLPIITGFSILRFRSWSYFLLLFFICFISAYYYLDFKENQTMSLITFLLFQSVNIIIGVYFLLPSVRNVYTKPQLRWWEQKPRYVLEHPVIIEASHQISPGLIKNISIGGMLIETELSMSKGDRFKIIFEMYQKKFELESQVAHVGNDGLGVFFTKILPSEESFESLISQMAQHGYPLRTPPPLALESFKDWIKDLVRGKGFTPKTESKKKQAP